MTSEAMNYAQVVCECPHGHMLGTVMGRWELPRPHYWASVTWLGRPMTKNTTESSGEPLTIGEKVKAACQACTKGGRYATDYQASWKRMAATLAEARDARAERITLRFE